MRFKEAILEFGFDCRARKLSDKTISNYQKQNWLKVLRDDKRFIVSAAARAEKAVNLILNQ